MARNDKATQAVLFKRLSDVLSGAGLLGMAIEPTKPRWIGGESEDTKALRTAELELHQPLIGLGSLAVYSLSGVRVVCATGELVSIAHGCQCLLSARANSGLAVLLFSIQECRPRASPQEVLDAFGLPGEMSLSQVASLFGGFATFELAPGVADENSAVLRSVLLSHLAAGLALSVHWSDRFGGEFEQLCRSVVSRFAGETLFWAASSSAVEMVFLGVYRALEGLFRVKMLEDFLGKLAAVGTVSRRSLDAAVNESLVWRVKELTALQRLFGALPPAERQVIGKLFGLPEGNVADCVYDLRNQIAHGRLTSGVPELSDDQLRGLMRFCESAYASVPLDPSWVD